MRYDIKSNTSSDASQKETLARTFKGSNALGARDIFLAKERYDFDAYSITGPTPVVSTMIPPTQQYTGDPIDLDGVYSIFNDTRLPLYGTVDKNVIPLQPKKQYLSFYLENNGGFTGLDFVINSFINMRTAYSRGMFEGKGIPTGFLLSSLEVTKSRDDASSALQANFDSIIKQFISYSRQDSVNRKKIITPEHFINYFTRYLLLYTTKKPVTYSTFLLTDAVDINFNGLCLDIASMAYDSDKEKVRDIILDPNFSYYRDTAISFGFVIAKEYPFKLIANLNSSRMRDNVCACGNSYLNGLQLTTADEIVDFYYEPAYVNDFGTLRSLYDLAYNTFLNTFRFETQSEYRDGSLHNKRIYRYSSQSILIQELLTDNFLLPIYIRMKNNEMMLKYTTQSLDRFTSVAKFMYNQYGLDTSLKYINEKMRLAVEAIRLDKKGFMSKGEFTVEEALALIRLTRYDY